MTGFEAKTQQFKTNQLRLFYLILFRNLVIHMFVVMYLNAYVFM